MTDDAALPPNPGSDEAIAAGCACPVLDNGHGIGYMGGMKDPRTGAVLFVLSSGCGVHWPPETPTAVAQADGASAPK